DVGRVAHPTEGPRDDLLRVAQPVDGRGVDPVDAGVQRLLDGGDGVAVVLGPPGEFPARPADGPGPEADRGDEQVGISKLSSLHSSPLFATSEVVFSGSSRATHVLLRPLINAEAVPICRGSDSYVTVGPRNGVGRDELPAGRRGRGPGPGSF